MGKFTTQIGVDKINASKCIVHDLMPHGVLQLLQSCAAIPEVSCEISSENIRGGVLCVAINDLFFIVQVENMKEGEPIRLLVVVNLRKQLTTGGG